ncbi:MAG: Riboflavin transporter [Paracidovorax wautersii]|uniref:Riboflavin transporter n=1 Tax=Paracidovorax wautersii TaxID=1177982 RepID=A0A7V8FQQ9_9BURK|nr:MAG: Riboflavin transporter [Paracidovorax wautersii]
MQALWMLLATLLFALMGVCVKLASPYYTTAELIFYRGIIGVMVLALLARSQGESLRTRYPGMHAWRSLIGVTSMGGWFYTIGYLPLATAVTLNYMSSIWIAAFIVGGALLALRPLKHETSPLRAQGPLAVTVILGFIGVLLMMRPSFEPTQLFAGMVGLLAGLLAAFAYLQVVALARVGEPETRTVFYFALGCAIAGGGAALAGGLSPWNWRGAIWLIPVGVLAALAQLCMTRAYARSQGHLGMLFVVNLQYSGIIFSSMLGLLIFAEYLPPIAWAGMALIIVSGVLASILRARVVPSVPAEDR